MYPSHILIFIIQVVDSISVHKVRVIITECAFKLRKNRDINVDAREQDITAQDAKQVINYVMKSIIIITIIFMMSHCPILRHKS